VRLAIVGPVFPFRGGIAHYTTMLARALRNRRHDLLLVSYKRQYPHWLFPGHSDRDPSEEAFEVGDAHFWIDSLNPLTWLSTFWRIRHHAPEVVVFQWWTSFWAPFIWTMGTLIHAFLNARVVMVCHNVLPHEARWYDTILARIALNQGDMLIVHSGEERELLLSLRPRAVVKQMALPLFDVFADQRMPQEEARQALGLPSDAPILLFFGIVREYKGLRDLLAALPAVREALGEVRLVVAGEFWEDKKMYLDMIDRLRLTGSVVIEDRYIPNEEVRLYFSAADVVVAPYRRVTGSAAAQAARGFGVPVITTWREEGERATTASLTANPGDVQSLEKAILHFFDMDHPQQKQAERATQEQQGSWDTLCRTIERAPV